MNFAFPLSQLRIRPQGNKRQVWDTLRRKWLILTPEEFVRQQLVHFLIHQKSISKSLIAIEKGLTFNQLQKRFDVVVFNRQGQPDILCECKAPEVPLSQETLYQASRYNSILHAPKLLLTNGLELWCFQQNEQGEFVEMDWFE